MQHEKKYYSLSDLDIELTQAAKLLAIAQLPVTVENLAIAIDQKCGNALIKQWLENRNKEKKLRHQP